MVALSGVWFFAVWMFYGWCVNWQTTAINVTIAATLGIAAAAGWFMLCWRKDWM